MLPLVWLRCRKSHYGQRQESPIASILTPSFFGLTTDSHGYVA